MKKVFKIILIGIIFISPEIVFGADIFIDSPKAEYRIGEQFIVGVSVVSDKENPINAVDLSIGFSQENLKFINSIERGSVISLFVERPKFSSGKVLFSGITPGGVYGVLDPLIDTIKFKPVKLIDLIFEPIAEGRAEVYLDKGEIFRSDGSGNIVVFNSWPKILNIKNEVFGSIIDFSDDTPPLPFSLEIIKEKSISEKYLLIFNTKDEESGIDYYEITEDGRKSVVAESPYILKNKKGRVVVRAFDKAGNIQTAVIDIPQKDGNNNINVIVLVAIIGLMSVLIYKKSRKIKKD